MTVGWITDAPIVKAENKTQAEVWLAELLHNMAGWETPSAIPEQTGTSEWANGQWAVWPNERKKWAKRALSSQGLVSDMLDELGDDEDAWFYRLGGHPIAAMTVDPDEGFIHIDYLVSHPGSADAGGVLIQKAVQLSSLAGFGGKVRLFAANKNARNMYLHMGFVNIDDGGRDDMALDPARSDKWMPDNSSYRYKSYVGGSRWAA